MSGQYTSNWNAFLLQYIFKVLCVMLATCGFDNSSENESDKITRLSRMHSSGMHTARLLTVSHGWVSAWGCLCPEMCLPGGVYHTPSPLHAGIHPPDRRNDTRLWKHYLDPNLFAGGKYHWQYYNRVWSYLLASGRRWSLRNRHFPGAG